VRTLFTCKVYKKKHTVRAGILLALAITCFVVVAVNLFIGERELPRQVKGSTPYFVLAGFLIAIPPILILILKRETLEILERGMETSLCVAVKGEETFQLNSPFTVEGTFFASSMGHGVKKREIFLTFYEHNEPVLTLYTALAVYHSVPEKFRYVDVFKLPAREGRARLSKKRFSCRKTSELFYLLREKRVLNFLPYGGLDNDTR
jgi:hypothetical protein